MSFDVTALLKGPNASGKSSTKPHWDDVASEIIVSGIIPAIELMDFHLDLKSAFERNTTGIRVDLSGAAFIRPEPTQECRIKLSRPLETTLVETTIHHALQEQYERRGLLYDPRAIHMVLANI